jgi:hypothetical protein
MARAVVVVFTGRPVDEILDPGARGSGDWRLDPARAREAEFLICTRNRHSPDFPPTPEPHRAAFLIGRVTDIVRSRDRPDRWLIRFDEFVQHIIPDIWGKSGHLRYPIWYTTLEELGIDLNALPPFVRLPPADRASGLSEGSPPLLIPAGHGTPRRKHPPARADEDARARFAAILAQLDRIPDLPAPIDPLTGDEHGLPR